LARVYSSQLSTKPRDIELTAETTSEIGDDFFPPMSELLVAADDGLLDHLPRRLELLRVDRDGGVESRSSIWAGGAPSAPMEWRIDGLQPGEYEAVLFSDHGPIALATAFASGNATASLQLRRPSVVVDGTVSFGARLAANTTLHFELERQRFTATTDQDGFYTVVLPKPGRYTARVEATKYFWSWTDEVDLREGRNRFDWRVPGATLEIGIHRDDGQPIDEPVQLECMGPAYRAAGPITVGEAGAPVVISGVAFGEVWCSADTASGFVAERARAMVSDASPHAKVDLRLRHMLGTLELRSADDRLVSGATVVAGNVTLPEQPPGSGLYTIRRSAPGEGMSIVATGHLPVCRVLSAGDFPNLRVSLTASSGLPVRFILTPHATRPPGYLHGLPGSECPVPLMALNPALRNVGQSTILDFALPAGTYQYQPFATYPLQTFSVPGAPLELTRTPK
jgi:hypothetical protein